MKSKLCLGNKLKSSLSDKNCNTNKFPYLKDHVRLNQYILSRKILEVTCSSFLHAYNGDGKVDKMKLALVHY